MQSGERFDETARTEPAAEDNDGYHVCRWNSCDNYYTSLRDLVDHVNRAHVESASIESGCQWEGCPKRGLALSARYKLVVHMRIHTHERPHVCTQCNKSFSRVENLRIHIRSHTGERPYTCPIEGCTKAYANSSDRHKHIKTHYTNRPYVCRAPGCGKSYTDPSSLRKHIKIQGHLRSTWYTVEEFQDVQNSRLTPASVKVEPEDDTNYQEYYGLPDNMIKMELQYPSEDESSAKRVCVERPPSQSRRSSSPPSTTHTYVEIPPLKPVPSQLGGCWVSNPGDCDSDRTLTNGHSVSPHPYLWYPYYIHRGMSPVMQCPKCRFVFEPVTKRTIATQTSESRDQQSLDNST